MMHFFDRDENYIGNSSEEYTLTRDLNKLNTLEFSLDYELEKGYRVVLIENNKVYEFIISEIDYVRNDYIMFSYLCNDSLIELNGYLIEEERQTETLKDNMDFLLKGTRFNYTISGYDTSIKKKTGYYRISVLEAFNDLINTFEIEFDVNIKLNSSKNAIEQRTIEIKRQGKKLNDRLEFGKNIIEFERNIFADEVYTALVGLGKGEEKFDEEGNATGGYGRKITFADVNNGIWYVEDLEAKEIYGIGKKGNKVHKMGIVNFSDVTNKNELLELTKKELQRVNHINAEYTIDVAVLGKEYNLGDEIPTIDDYINYRDYMRVVKIVSTPSGSTLTFGTRMASFTSSQNKVIKDLQEETQNEVQSVIRAFLENSSELFFGKDGYPYTLEANNDYGLPAGIYVFDKPIDQNPSGLVGIGGGSIVIANNKDADGKWQVVTAINSQGIAGSEILSHSITVNKLAADVGKSLDLSSNESIELKVQNTIIENKDILKGEPGKDGDNWSISSDGYWVKNGVKTSTKAVGEDGKDGATGPQGPKGDPGEVDYTQFRSDYESEINQLSDEINLRVKSSDYMETIDKLNGTITSIEELSLQTTELVQTSSGFEQRFTKVESSIDDNQSGINEIKAVVSTGLDENGNTYTEWGSTSDSKVRVGADGIDMISNNQETMTLRDGEVQAKALYVTETIGFGNHTAQKYGEEFTIFSWNGGN